MSDRLYDYIQTWIVLFVLAGIGLFALLHQQQQLEKDNRYTNSASSTARSFAPRRLVFDGLVNGLSVN